MTISRRPTQIGTLQEKSLHAELKQFYARPGDQLEVPLDGFVIDIVRGDLLIEIQTRNFSQLKRKLERLMQQHRVRLVHPIAQEKWIVRVGADGRAILGRRKSPKRGAWQDIFLELVSLPLLITHPNFSLEVLLIREEEIRRVRDANHSSRRRWHRGWQAHDHKLIEVIERRVFESPSDYATFLPRILPQPFTNQDLAQALGQPYVVAQTMSYCLCRMGTIDVVGKRGRAILYSTAEKGIV